MYWNIINEDRYKLLKNITEKVSIPDFYIIDGEIKELLPLKDFSILEHYKKKASYLVALFKCIKMIKHININQNCKK